MDAARNGDREALRTLIRKSADVNAPDADGATALQWASYRDDLENVELLLRLMSKEYRACYPYVDTKSPVFFRTTMYGPSWWKVENPHA